MRQKLHDYLLFQAFIFKLEFKTESKSLFNKELVNSKITSCKFCRIVSWSVLFIHLPKIGLSVSTQQLVCFLSDCWMHGWICGKSLENLVKLNSGLKEVFFSSFNIIWTFYDDIMRNSNSNFDIRDSKIFLWKLAFRVLNVKFYYICVFKITKSKSTCNRIVECL